MFFYIRRLFNSFLCLVGSMSQSQAAPSGISSKVRGIAPCPSPVMDKRVALVMGQWGRWQWRNREQSVSHGYPTINVLSVSWGLGRGDDFEYEDEMMPPLVELANQIIMDMKGPAQVFAWARWAQPHSGNVSQVVRAADTLLPYDVSRVDCERWLGAIAGAVMATLGDVELEVE